LPGASSDRTGLVASISGMPPRSDPRLADQGGSFLMVLGGVMFTAGQTMREGQIGPGGARSNHPAYDKQEIKTVGGRQVPVSQRMTMNEGSENGRLSQTIGQSETYAIPDKVTGELEARVQDRTTGSFEMSVCPDASGAATGRVEVFSENIFDAVSGPGYHSTYVASDDFSVQVTDLAAIGGTRHTIETHRTNSGRRPAFGANPAAVVDSTSGVIRSSETGPDGATVGTPLTTVTESVGVDAADTAVEAFAASFVQLLENQLVEGAADRWRSGDCVDVKVLQGNGGEVEAGSETQIVAQPRHKIDQVDLAKPVVASFSGKASVEPVGVAIPAPAQFTYTAGEDARACCTRCRRRRHRHRHHRPRPRRPRSRRSSRRRTSCRPAWTRPGRSGYGAPSSGIPRAVASRSLAPSF
jgi:hypothetical protein